MDLKKFYIEVLESFGMTVDKDGYVKIGDDEFIIDNKPVVIPTVKIVSMLKSTGKAEVYLFNPLKGNKNIVREEYKKLLYVMNVNLYVAVKSLMVDITEKFMNNDSSGIATPTTFAKLMSVKGQAKTLVDDGVLKAINDLAYEDVVEVNIKRNDVVLGEKVDAALNIYSPALNGDIDSRFSRRKEKDYIKKLLSIILDPIMDDRVTSSAGDKAQFMVLLKANAVFYQHLSEFAEEHEVDLNYPAPQYDMKEFGEDYDVLVSYAETLPDVVGDEVIISDGLTTECKPERTIKSSDRRSALSDKGDVIRTKKDMIIDRITELKHKDTLTLKELSEIRELEAALEEYEVIDKRGTRLGRRPRRRAYDDYDDYDGYDDYDRRRSMVRRRRPPSVGELYEMRRSGRLDMEDDVPW